MVERGDGVYSLTDRGASVYLIRSGDEALLIDSGFDSTAAMILAELHAMGVKRIARILLTHGHGDHYEGCARIVRAFGSEVGIHPADARLITETGDVVLYRELNRSYPDLFPVPAEHQAATASSLDLTEGVVVRVGERRLRALHTPGHSEGSVCLLEEERGLLFSGDAVSGDFVHFYCAPAVLEKTLGRIAFMPIARLLMAHAYPPEGASVLDGGRARRFVERSAGALMQARSRVANRLREDPGITAQRLTEELHGPTLIAVIRMMEEARGGR